MSLRPLVLSDYEPLLLAELSDSLGLRWRLRGRTPAPETYGQTLWNGVLTQYVVTKNRDSRPIGLVCLYNVDLQNGFGYLAVTTIRDQQSLLVMEGLCLFIDHVFAAWPLRKLCGEAIEFNYSAFRSGAGDVFVEEGTLRDHAYLDGRYWDVVLIAIFRENWERKRSAFIRYIRGHE